MKTTLASLMVLALFLTPGCSIFKGADIAEGADPVVVYAQRSQQHSLDTFNEFLLFEKNNRALINDPAVKAAADNIRANYARWDDDLTTAIKTYQLTRSQSDAGKIDLTLNLLHQAVGIARHYLITKAVTINKGLTP